jgi:hypothetical protein
VIYEGKIMGETTDSDVQKIGMMMTGTTLEQIQQGAEERG